MSSNLDELTADAMKLSLRDRVQLAQRLVSTLDDEVEADTEALCGLDFLTAVEAATRRIEQLPESVPISEAHIRKRLVTGFPFTISTNFNLIESSSPPSCINIADRATGENGSSLEARSRSEQRYWPLSNL